MTVFLQFLQMVFDTLFHERSKTHSKTVRISVYKKCHPSDGKTTDMATAKRTQRIQSTSGWTRRRNLRFDGFSSNKTTALAPPANFCTTWGYPWYSFFLFGMLEISTMIYVRRTSFFRMVYPCLSLDTSWYIYRIQRLHRTANIAGGHLELGLSWGFILETYAS